jgi:hypothetical protein
MNDQESYDWIKHATQTAVDDREVEKAFMDQAYGFIANKAGELMNDPYRLGFEVVSKNDNNSRMVGIFAFRIDKDLLYAPTFFINGEIKGTDLLYRHNTKGFVPLEEEWVTYLIERNEQGTGNGLNKGERRYMQSDTNLQQLISPNAKSAAEDMAKAAGFESMTDWMNKVAEQQDPGPVLRDFLLNDAYVPGLAWLEKAATNSIDFAESLVTCCGPDDYAPDGLYAAAEKRASEIQAPASRRFSLHIGSLPDGEKSASQIDEFYKSGTLLIDERQNSEDKLSVVHEDATRDLQQFEGPGLYKVLMSDGSMAEAFVARESQEHFGDATESCCHSDGGGSLSDYELERAVVTLSDGGATRECSKILGQSVKDLHECLHDESVLHKSMSTGQSYRIFQCGDGTLSRPIHVISKREREGITSYEVAKCYGDTVTLTRNPEFEGTHFAENILGDDALFLKVDAKYKDSKYGEGKDLDVNTDVKIGTRANVDDWIYGRNGLFKMKVEKTASEELMIRANGCNSNAMGPLTATVALAQGYRIPGVTAQSVVKLAQEQGSITFWLEPHEKAAGTVMRLAEEPDFHTDYDSIHQVERETPQGYNLNTNTDSDEPIDPRIGDAWDPTSADGLPANVLGSAAPEELEQLAKLHKLPHVFEHGVVGAMAQTFDSAAMISKYMPNLEKALDCMGRILFLFYWKPGDFEDAYGSDDMINLENELLSNFKSFGALVLNLLKKTKKTSEGSPPLPS